MAYLTCFVMFVPIPDFPSDSWRDVLLVLTVHSAAKENCTPDQFEKRVRAVGVRPFVNTAVPSDLRSWGRMSTFYDQESQHDEVVSADQVIFWRRPGTLRIIGVYWSKGGCKTFYGRLGHAVGG